MSRVDAYLRALENGKLDEYYERKGHPPQKLHKFNKGRWNDKAQAKYTGKACRQNRGRRRQKPK